MHKLNKSAPMVKRFIFMIEAEDPQDDAKGVLGGYGMQRLLGSLGDRLDDDHIQGYWALCCEDYQLIPDGNRNERPDLQYLARMCSALMRHSVERDERNAELIRLRAQVKKFREILEGGAA